MGCSLTFTKESAVHDKDTEQSFCIIEISTVRFGKVNDPYLSFTKLQPQAIQT